MAICRIRCAAGCFLTVLTQMGEAIIPTIALMDEMKGSAVAALAASLATRLRRAAEGAGRGAPRFMHLTATGGTLLVAPYGAELILVAVAERTVNAGLARLEMFRSLEMLG